MLNITLTEAGPSLCCGAVDDGDDWHVCESHDLVHSGAETDYRIETLSHEATEATLVITGS